jgi:TRAP transporter TAXI family solute receptor
MGARKNQSFVWAAVLAFAVALVVSPSARAQSGQVTLRLATGSVGGTFLPVGQDLVQWWEHTVPGVKVEIVSTAGSVDNLNRLISGEADIAVVGASPFREVLNGWGTRNDEAKTICTLGTLYMDAEQFVVRSSLVRIGNLLDLTGLLMYPGPHGSGGEIDTRRIMSVLEIEPTFVYVDERTKGYAAAATALVRGDFDAATFSGGVPIQAVTALFREHPGEFQILPFSRHMLNKVTHYEDFEGVVIRQFSYPGMKEDVHTVGGPNILVASPNVELQVLMLLDTAIREGIAEPGKGLRAESSHPVLQVLDLELWSQDPVGVSCLETGIADLESSSETEGSTPR